MSDTCQELLGALKKLSFKQENALRELIQGATIAEAADAVGISSRTVFRWLQLSAFSARLREGQSEALTKSLYRLQAASGLAVDALPANLNDGNAWVVQAAAIGILDRAMKARELFEFGDLAERIARLEKWSRHGNQAKAIAGSFGKN